MIKTLNQILNRLNSFKEKLTTIEEKSAESTRSGITSKQTKIKKMNLSFKIATWNANRLAQHAAETLTFVKLHIDVLLVSEIYFTKKG